MKTLTFIFTLAIFVTAASAVSFGQKREITKEIYDTEVRAAYQKARTFLPRRVSTFDYDGKLSSYFEYDTKGSLRYVTLPNAIYYKAKKEFLAVGEFGYSKEGDENWECTERDLALAVASEAGTKAYHVEAVSLDGVTFTSYTETNLQYTGLKSEILVDDLGRIVIKRELYGSEEKFEYDIKLDTILAPNVKCLPEQK